MKVLSLPEEKLGNIRYEFQMWDNPQWLYLKRNPACSATQSIALCLSFNFSGHFFDLRLLKNHVDHSIA